MNTPELFANPISIVAESHLNRIPCTVSLPTGTFPGVAIAEIKLTTGNQRFGKFDVLILVEYPSGRFFNGEYSRSWVQSDQVELHYGAEENT